MGRSNHFTKQNVPSGLLRNTYLFIFSDYFFGNISTSNFLKMSLLVVVILALFIWILVKHFYISYRFPPGLPRLPLVGTLPFLNGEIGSRVLISSVKLIPKYGDILGYFMGPSVK
jgi:hypothetical protein